MNELESTTWATFVVVAVGILGLLVGSFLNVVIYRVPAGKSIVSPPSACPSCGARIRPRDNVPVISWIALRGRCRNCAAPISRRYPLVELATGVLFACVAAWMLSRSSESTFAAADTLAAFLIELAAFFYLSAIGVALFMIDLDTRRLPNAIVVPSYVVAALLLTAAGLVDFRPEQLIGAAIGGAAMFAFYFALAFAYPGGMGFGDVKLAGVLGLYLGWTGWGALAVGAFAAFLLGGAFSILIVTLRGAGRKTAIPFGPWMIAGAFVGIFFGEGIALGYLSITGLV
jgi:leader peptidase (prepilin peptidase)/N-methyltransferase